MFQFCWRDTNASQKSKKVTFAHVSSHFIRTSHKTCALSSATANQVNDLTVEDEIKIHAEKITEPFCSVNAGTRKQK